MERQFKARKGSYITDKQAMIYGNHILKLKERLHTNYITPRIIVEDAKNSDAPYHNFFEWNNKQAANKWREQQARVLLGSIVELKIVKEEQPRKEIKLFYKTSEGGGEGYVDNDFAFSHEEVRKQIIEEALQQLRYWRNKYKIYKELAGVVEGIDKLLQFSKVQFSRVK